MAVATTLRWWWLFLIFQPKQTTHTTHTLDTCNGSTHPPGGDGIWQRQQPQVATIAVDGGLRCNYGRERRRATGVHEIVTRRWQRHRATPLQPQLNQRPYTGHPQPWWRLTEEGKKKNGGSELRPTTGAPPQLASLVKKSQRPTMDSSSSGSNRSSSAAVVRSSSLTTEMTHPRRPPSSATMERYQQQHSSCRRFF
ncbi:unnamed protein product [Lactuca virosa]|uniref:Secreted protein n=1 Tax=Lactuca virosa TaxID=75947 RepID=A0AAU9MKC7_9ASTR|nr:unnamed protein product [Lactuca virosa]